MKTFIAYNYKRLKELYAKYERLLMSAMLVGGFLVDFIAFVNIDIVFKFSVLIFYWFAAGLFIAFMQLYDAGRIPQRFRYVRLFSPLAVQFAFGGLLNISLIFYWFSGTFSVSWPVLLLLVLLLIFNETFRHYYAEAVVQISVYFFCTLSLFSLILPYVFTSLSAWLFVAAEVASLIIFIVYIYGLSAATKRPLAQSQFLFAAIFFIAAAMNALYFANIIPPIPLALREAGLYHSLRVTNNQYVMKGEPETLWQNVQDALFGQTVHVTVGEKIYLYTAIFAPDNLDATIVDRWQYYDEAQKAWVDQGKLSFAINGGRWEGYKGYSWQTNLAAGKWRVYVQNQRSQVLARVRFTVERVAVPVQLQEVIR